MIAKVRLPLAQKDSQNQKDFTNFGNNANNNPKQDNKIEVEIKIKHDGDVNKAKSLPFTSKYSIIATQTDKGEIHIFDYFKHPNQPKEENEESKPELKLKGHEKSGFGLDWSIINQGSLLSGNEDGKVCLWREINDTTYDCLYEYRDEEKATSMNYIAFSKNNTDLTFASGGADGNITIHQYINDKFSSEKIFAHDYGVNSINFSQNNPNEFVSCGNDSIIKIWVLNKESLKWENTSSIDDIDIIFNEAIFRPGSNEECLACCGDEGQAYLIWKEGQKWNKKEISSFDKGISQLSWDDNGTTLMAVLNDGELLPIDQENLILVNDNEN